MLADEKSSTHAIDPIYIVVTKNISRPNLTCGVPNDMATPIYYIVGPMAAETPKISKSFASLSATPGIELLFSFFTPRFAAVND